MVLLFILIFGLCGGAMVFGGMIQETTSLVILGSVLLALAVTFVLFS